MTYRDDVDTLYERALLLQKELDAARDELAHLKGRRPDTHPGLRALPDLDEAHDRLIDTSDLEEIEPSAMPDWAHIVNAKMTPAAPPPAPPSVSPRIPGLPRPPPMPTARSLVERVRDRVARLGEEDLVLVAKIIEELTDGRGHDELLRNRLRWLAGQLAFGMND